MDTLTHALLRDYADAFRTHGDPSSPVWFLGLEEGGGESLEEAARTILAWERAGRPASTDLTGPNAHGARPENRFLRTDGEPAGLQATRANELRVLLGLRGEAADNRAIRRLQTHGHGRRGGPTCLMELFPLPCRDASAWIYDRVPHDPDVDGPNAFASKRDYREHYLPRRLATIAALVHEHRPGALVCTSWTHRGQIVSMLDDVRIPELGLEGVRRRAVVGTLGDTVVAVCSHPAKRIGGPRNEFYHRLGRAVAERMPSTSQGAMAA